MRHRTPRDGPGEFVPLWYVSNLMAVVHDILACGTVIDDVESSLFDEGCWSQTLDVCELVHSRISIAYMTWIRRGPADPRG